MVLVILYHSEMRAEKRFWIYSGLGVPEGVALVRRPRRSLARDRVLLLGKQEVVQALTPLLARLAEDAAGDLIARHQEGSTRSWVTEGWLSAALAECDPTLVFLAMDPTDVLARRAIRARLRRAKAEEFWLIPPGVSVQPSSRFIASEGTDARSLAAWAARAWSVTR